MQVASISKQQRFFPLSTGKDVLSSKLYPGMQEVSLLFQDRGKHLQESCWEDQAGKVGCEPGAGGSQGGTRGAGRDQAVGLERWEVKEEL